MVTGRDRVSRGHSLALPRSTDRGPLTLHGLSDSTRNTGVGP